MSQTKPRAVGNAKVKRGELALAMQFKDWGYGTLAKHAGLHKSTVSTIMKRREYCSVDTARKISKALGHPPEQFFLRNVFTDATTHNKPRRAA